MVTLVKPLMACPMLSLRLRSVEKDFFLCMAGLLANGSDTSSSAGGVGRYGRAVMVALLGIVDVEELRDVVGRNIEERLLLLVVAAEFFII